MGYFKTIKISEDTYYIREPLGVGAYLFIGKDKALLSDTCNGFMDIRPAVKRITNKPYIVMNTHGHADHAGGDAQFEEVFLHKDDIAMLDEAWQKGQQDLLFGYAKKVFPLINILLLYFKLHKFRKYKTKAHIMEDGYAFELGGRTIRTVHLPGHSPGSVILLDEQTRSIYAGDAINNGLFLFFENSPTVKQYAERLRSLLNLKGYDYIRVSHDKNPLPFSFISYCADFLERVDLEKSELTDFPNGDNPVYKYCESGEKFSLREIAVFYTKNNL